MLKNEFSIWIIKFHEVSFWGNEAEVMKSEDNFMSNPLERTHLRHDNSPH